MKFIISTIAVATIGRVAATNGPDARCGTIPKCTLVNLETNGERNVLNSVGIDLTPNGAATFFDPKSSSKGWTIKCQEEGKVSYVKYFFEDGSVNTHYSSPFYAAGDGEGTWLNKLDLFTNSPCAGDVKIDVKYYTWDGGDEYPCGSFSLKLKTPTLPPANMQCHLCRICKNFRLYTSGSEFLLPYNGTPQVQVVSRGNVVTVPPTNLPVPAKVYKVTSTLVDWLDYSNNVQHVADGSVYTRSVNQCGATVWKKCSVGSPIALDLDMSGDVEYITGNFDFDLSGNGIPEELTQWFGPHEGILVDSTYPGFDSGNLIGWHLYGDLAGTYDDGFDKLALHDFNEDGEVSGDELNGIQLWIDANSNAVLDDGELDTLENHGVISLSLSHDEEYVSSATVAGPDGLTQMKTKDLWLSR